MLLQHIPPIGNASYIAIFLIYSVFCFIFIYDRNYILHANRNQSIILLFLIATATLSLLFNTSGEVLIRYLTLLSVTVLSIFVLPKLIPAEYFFHTVSRLSVILVCLGFLPYFGVTMEGSYFDLSLWHGRIYWNEDFAPITSIFANPNALGIITVVGAVSSFFELSQEHKNWLPWILLIVNMIGLVFTNYRTGWVAFAIAVCVYSIYMYGGRALLTAATIAGVSATFTLFLMMFSVLPGPTTLTEISLNNRRGRWIGGFHALTESPWWGYGFGNVTDAVQPYTTGETGNVHNSFVRVFVGYGILGGILYTTFYLLVLLDASRLSVDDLSATIFSLLVVFFFIQLLNDLTFIGVSFPSVTAALMIGYVVISRTPKRYGNTANKSISC